MCRRVDLPEPEGPITAVKWPLGSSTDTPSNASTAVSPSPKRRRRSLALTIGSEAFMARTLPSAADGRGADNPDGRYGQPHRARSYHPHPHEADRHRSGQRAAHRSARRAAPRAGAPARRPTRAAALHAPQPDAHAQVPAPARAVGALARVRQAAAHRRHRLHRPGRDAADRLARANRARPLVVARARHQAALPRGRDLDRRQDGTRAELHDLGLPARVDRPRVRDRRPRDVDRLRSRRGGGGAPDPPAGDLQARRPGGQQRLARLRRVRAARGDHRRQRDRGHQCRGHPRRAGQRGGGGRSRPRGEDARGAPAPALGVSSRERGLLAQGPWEAGSVRARWAEEPFDAGAQAEAQADAAIASLRERGSPTHDGLGARLAAFEQDGGELALELEPARWALRLGDDALDSISALCAVRDSEGRWLAGRRAPWVATWAGRWALGAGGAVDVGENPADTLARELHEEWSVQPERLSVEALVRLPNGLVLLVGMAHLPTGAQVQMDPEHGAHAWWPPDPGNWPEEADQPDELLAAGDLHQQAPGPRRPARDQRQPAAAKQQRCGGARLLRPAQRTLISARAAQPSPPARETQPRRAVVARHRGDAVGIRAAVAECVARTQAEAVGLARPPGEPRGAADLVRANPPPARGDIGVAAELQRHPLQATAFAALAGAEATARAANAVASISA